MAIVGAARADGFEVEARHQRDGLQLRRALGPESALEELDVAEAQADGLFDARFERCQVFPREQTVARRGELRDLGCDIAAVERGVRILGVREIVERARQRLVLHELADLGHARAGEIELCAARPL